MKVIVEDVSNGQVETVEVPAPELRSSGILVRTAFSAVSAGTERAKLETSEKSLMGKAFARPDLVRQVWDTVQQQGIVSAYRKVQSRLTSLSPLGYSCSGTVIAIGDGVREFRVGDRVACGGAGYANHAEINFIPKNLAARVPNGVALEAASLTTVGAIALHGFRQSGAALGESVAIVGAGLVGLLTLQIAKAAGCRTLVVDLDPMRVETAKKMGCDFAFVSDSEDANSLTAGSARLKADVAIITAASSSSLPIEMAARLVRDRGRLVVVGDVSLDLSRRLAYEKELSVVLSRSYGPGRYDPVYEETGLDYPVSYVRWTENRNMEAFLMLLERGEIDVSSLLTCRFPVESASQAYAEIRKRNAYTVILTYASAGETAERNGNLCKDREKRPSLDGSIRISAIGAGSFARDVIFPSLLKQRDVKLDEISSASGISAESARRKFGFRATRGVDQLLESGSPDLLFILTRHESHAPYILRALQHNLAVFVEKPLATCREHLEELKRAYEIRCEKEKLPFIMVGFNRRFAPMTRRIQEFFAGRREPMAVQIRVNAGYLPPEHWTHENGGRPVGELCHFVDWARAVVGTQFREVSAVALPDSGRYQGDNLSTTLTFCDGSIANILYLANGDRDVPKEYFEVFCSGKIARLDDFRALSLSSSGSTKTWRSLRDKGHSEQLRETLRAVRAGESTPIPFRESVEVTEITFAIMEAIQKNAHDSRQEGAPARLAIVAE